MGVDVAPARMEDGRRRRRPEPSAVGATVQPDGSARESTIAWHYVRGHTGIPGNERVDEIADAFAVHRDIPLYEGPLSGYARPVLDLPDDTSVPNRTPGSAPRSSKAAAYSYLSVVDGTPMRHATWPECDRRVKGRSGARYKKAMSAADEAAILRGWQFEPEDI